MEIYTSYLSFVLKHNLFNDPEYYPVSIMRFKPSWYKDKFPELKELAPSQRLLLKYKSGDIDNSIYETEYFEEVIRRYRREDVEELILDRHPIADGRKVVLFCVCGPGKLCHRKLLGSAYDFQELQNDDLL